MRQEDFTVVVAVRGKLGLFKQFYRSFREQHPNIPLAVGALQVDVEMKEYLKELLDADPLVKASFGDPVDGHRVSLSENYNSAINLVETKALVLAHTDLYFSKDFFKNLSKNVKEKTFYVYTTMEPLVYLYHRRPGKILGDFGTTFEDFDKNSFEEYCRTRIYNTPEVQQPGYGFFLVGSLEDFQKVGGFDSERFVPVFCEDDDFSVRIRLAGYPVKVLPHAVSFHFVSQTSRDIVGGAMTELEVQSNRVFARKWGFESRYLWGTGYEAVPKFEIFKRTVEFRCNGSDIDLKLVEPMVQNITGVPEEHESKDVRAKINAYSKDSCDILVEQQASLDLSDLVCMFNFLGQLRLSRELEQSTYILCDGKMKIHILNAYNIQAEDDSDYLSLQKSIRYE